MSQECMQPLRAVESKEWINPLEPLEGMHTAHTSVLVQLDF